MRVLASDAFGVDHAGLVKAGAYDRFTDIDALLYLDPHLLDASQAPELAGAYARFQEHFRDIIALIQGARDRRGALWIQPLKRLTFHEVAGVGLGSSKSKDSGSAIGPGSPGQSPCRRARSASRRSCTSRRRKPFATW
jgi:hypothetical protein